LCYDPGRPLGAGTLRTRLPNPGTREFKSSHIARVAHDKKELEDSINDPQADWVYVRYLPSAEDVRRIHQEGKRVFIAGKTVSGEEVANWKVATDIGIDGILTDHALTLQSLLRK